MLAERYTAGLADAVRGKCLGLRLRREFQGGTIRNLACELSNTSATGASQLPAETFFEASYPTGTILQGLEALAAGHGRPIILTGRAGSGKSHALGVFHHALSEPETAQEWLETWSRRLGHALPARFPEHANLQVLSENLDGSVYQVLWDYVLNWHFRGEWGRAQSEEQGRILYEVPAREIFEEMFRLQPAVFLFDGFERWLANLPDSEEQPFRTRSWQLVQLLAEIAKDYPNRIAMVFSIDDKRSDAFEKLEFLSPRIIDTELPSARGERAHWLVHRMFENRWEIAECSIRAQLEPYVEQYVDTYDTPVGVRPTLWRAFLDAWPFVPGLVRLIEDRIDVDDPAQSARVTVKLLADLFERQPRRTRVINVSDIGLNDDDEGIALWLGAAMNEEGALLRERAIENLTQVFDAVGRTKSTIPHAAAIMSALWVRSVTPRDGDDDSGSDLRSLLLDITHGEKIGVVALETELATIRNLSLFVHEDNGRYRICDTPNPRNRLLIEAHDNTNFKDGSDQRELANQIRHVIGAREDVAHSFRLVVLRRHWQVAPWREMDEECRPPAWDGRIVLLVVPEAPHHIESTLGRWLRDHVPNRRNTIRFLLPSEGSGNVYEDPELLLPIRGMLLADRWETEDPAYLDHYAEFQARARELIRKRFDRFAVVDIWDDEDARRSRFHVVKHESEGAGIPDAVDAYIRQNLVKPGCFDEMLLEFAHANETVGAVLAALQEPRPNRKLTIPWIGHSSIIKKLEKLCAEGRITLDISSTRSGDRGNDPRSHQSTASDRLARTITSDEEAEQVRLSLPGDSPSVDRSAGGGAGGTGKVSK